MRARLEVDAVAECKGGNEVEGGAVVRAGTVVGVKEGGEERAGGVGEAGYRPSPLVMGGSVGEPLGRALRVG